MDKSRLTSVKKAYVSHWAPLVERRAYLEPALRRFGIEAEWITEFDSRNLPAQLIEKFYRPDLDLFIQRAALGGALQQPLRPRTLFPAEVANGITHLDCYRRLLESNEEAALILEDDLLLYDDFDLHLEGYMKQLPSDWDLLYPGSGFHLHVPNPVPNRQVYLHPRRESRTADCYVIRRKAAEKLLPAMTPFVLPIDWELSYHQYHLDLQVYWGEPSLCEQGTERGTYRSTMQRSWQVLK